MDITTKMIDFDRVPCRWSISAALALVAWVLGCQLTFCDEPLITAVAREPLDFHREVLPILREHCHRCHGGVRREGDLSLLSRKDATADLPSGAIAVVPSEPKSSELLRRVTSTDDTERMPPEGDPLTSKQIDTLRRWIAEGANWEPHWSYQSLRRPTPPQSANLLTWPRNRADQFVLNRLHAASVGPSIEAPRFTLIRRLYLDLTGLLPTIEEVEAFCNDTRPNAYEQLVDRLLASPHVGERWGRHWLDQARYADTDGFEVDGPRKTAWLWRDWVIDSLNADMPFDQFTLEQIAGDLLPNATTRQRLATGFHRQSLTNKEGGIDKGEARYRELVDRVNAVGTIWFGMTVGCAQCHNHPYDPLTQREFFELLAFFHQTDDTDLALDENQRDASRSQRKRSEGKQDNDSQGAQVVSQANEFRPTTMYHRGDFLQPGETVLPHVLDTLHSLLARSESTAPPSRLELARWMTAPENPLTPRVAANQVWIRLFGAGLVRTPDDLGAHGELPLDPGLLDWLACEYRDRGWSTKQLIRFIVTSSTYRQASKHRPEVQAIDPLNELWHRQNRYRVEAEVMHDLHLAAAGLLTAEIGGPSFYPPLPEEVAKLSFRSNYVWKASTGSNRYRRGMYIFYKRTLPHPNLDTFDCPDATIARMHRDISNNPLQALATLNNEVFWEAAQALAQQVCESHLATDEQRFSYLFRQCLGRLPSAEERQTLEKLLAASRSWYQQQPVDAAAMIGRYVLPNGDSVEQAAWTVVCNVTLNMDEFFTRE